MNTASALNLIEASSLSPIAKIQASDVVAALEILRQLATALDSNIEDVEAEDVIAYFFHRDRAWGWEVGDNTTLAE